MTKYVIKRIIMIIPIIFGVILVLFAAMYVLPGSRINMLPAYGDGDALDSIFRFFKAGNNFFTKYIRYCYDVFIHFDFGRVGQARLNLSWSLNYRLRNTLMLLISGVGATLIIGIPLGVYSAVHKNRLRDRIINIVSLFFSSLPNYSIAMALTLAFVVYLRVWPLFIVYTSPRAYLLPAITISLSGAASVVRMTRTSMIEALRQPHITALRSKGLSERSVVYRHALKNALIPVVSVLGGLVSQLLFGTLVVEYFFNVPGLGSFLLSAVGSRALITILGSTIVLAIVLSVTNIASDILCAFANPQIRLRYARSGSGSGGAQRGV